MNRMTKAGLVAGALMLGAVAGLAMVGHAAAEVAAVTPIVATVDPSPWALAWAKVHEMAGALFNAALVIATPVVVYYVNHFLGARAASLAQAALASAADRAASHALNAPGELEHVMANEVQPGDSVVQKGVDYLNTTMASTIKSVGATDGSLRKLVVAKLNEKVLPSLIDAVSGGGPLRMMVGEAVKAALAHKPS